MSSMAVLDVAHRSSFHQRLALKWFAVQLRTCALAVTSHQRQQQLYFQAALQFKGSCQCLLKAAALLCHR